MDTKIKTLVDYLAVMNNANNPYHNKPIYQIIIKFEEENPKLFEQFKFEHQLIYGMPLLTSYSIIPF